MIFIYYRALAEILPPSMLGFSTRQQKQALQQHRQALLQQRYPQWWEKRSATGKPMSDCDKNVAFNQSHTHNYYALAYSENWQDIGIDIEDKQRGIQTEALAQRILHPAEQALWQHSDNRQLLILQLWTIKEAIVKAHGLGIRLALNSINSRWQAGQSCIYTQHPDLGQFYYHCFDMPHSLLTVAYRANLTVTQTANICWL